MLYLDRIARISLEESRSRGELLALTVYQAATEAAAPEVTAASLQAEPVIRVLVQAGMAYSDNVTYVAITDTARAARSSTVRRCWSGEAVPRPRS